MTDPVKKQQGLFSTKELPRYDQKEKQYRHE
jgi:hypothetical protein